jgi:ParB family transcriptional regulator, chromosome partitioning protein
MTTKPEMMTVATDRLRPNPWNTNRVSPENETKLEESIRRYGIYKPIIVREVADKQLEIIGGEHRWGAASRMGITEVPVVNLGTISEKRAKEIGLADNGRYGEDDTLGLAELLKELGMDDVSAFLPYTDAELESVFSASSIALDDLDLDDTGKLADLTSAIAPTQTTQVMRFKVPVEDSAWCSLLIEREMKIGGFTKEDSLSNAGNAFVAILKKYRESL